jgi:hypothetical protein
MIKKRETPTLEQIEHAEHILDEVEAFWHAATKRLRAYSTKDGGAVIVHPKNLANFLAENPNAKSLELPRLDRRMLQLVKKVFQTIKSERPDEVSMFLSECRNTERPSDERLNKIARLVDRGDLAAYIVGDDMLMIRDEDVEDFERDHPEAERLRSVEQIEEFTERLQKKLRVA